jgi:hypothetical protein
MFWLNDRFSPGTAIGGTLALVENGELIELDVDLKNYSPPRHKALKGF